MSIHGYKCRFKTTTLTFYNHHMKKKIQSVALYWLKDTELSSPLLPLTTTRLNMNFPHLFPKHHHHQQCWHARIRLSIHYIWNQIIYGQKDKGKGRNKVTNQNQLSCPKKTTNKFILVSTYMSMASVKAAKTNKTKKIRGYKQSTNMEATITIRRISKQDN